MKPFNRVIATNAERYAWHAEHAAIGEHTTPESLEHGIDAALTALLAEQQADGHWVYPLEADATIPAEYLLMRHHLGEPVDASLEAAMGRYLRRLQNVDGGWPLFHDGDVDVSASVKAYFALKMIGDSPDAAHMRRARDAIAARGGAEACNVFTRILLALYGVVSWRAVPVMPAEIMLLPRWSPFHLSKVSYWSRTVIVPLLVLGALQPRARNPRSVRIDELFLRPPHEAGMPARSPHQDRLWFGFFRALDRALRTVQPHCPPSLRQRAIDAAVGFVRERLNAEHGLGAIFPAMVNAVLMFDALGMPPDDPDAATARDAIDRLLLIGEGEAYCQPCVSPIWDTALMSHALMETGDEAAIAAARRGLEWLRPQQILDVRGDWSVRRADLRPGGWAFQYANAHYPDVDDTAVVAMALHRADALSRHRADVLSLDRADALTPHGSGDNDEALTRALEWVAGMQSRDGGWGAFEPDNTMLYLNHIPFSDHGALLDPPTVDVSARCLSMLAQIEGASIASGGASAASRALDYVLANQESNGSWYGRWGINYIYGTWSALCALRAAGLETGAPSMRRAAAWLRRIQNADGGWGEHGSSYRLDYNGHQPAESTASQTAWALLGLMAAGEVRHPALARGIAWLLERQRGDGLWDEAHHTATGFPRVFYLRYHGYPRYFPLWALARYRNLKWPHACTVGHARCGM